MKRSPRLTRVRRVDALGEPERAGLGFVTAVDEPLEGVLDRRVPPHDIDFLEAPPRSEARERSWIVVVLEQHAQIGGWLERRQHVAERPPRLDERALVSVEHAR